MERRKLIRLIERIILFLLLQLAIIIVLLALFGKVTACPPLALCNYGPTAGQRQ